MKIYSWNVNGIRAVINKGEFAKFIDMHQPDILSLQETKAKEEQVELELDGYYQYWNSANKAGYSGTAIFSKIPALKVINNIPANIADTFKLSDTYGDTNTEGRVLAAEFEGFWVVSVYTPNSKGKLERLPLRTEQWDKAFLAYMQELEATKPVIFNGDLNVAHTEIDLARPDDNHKSHGFTDQERAGFDAIIAAGFIDTFRLFTKEGGHYSWWTAWSNARARNVGWRIDYVVASKSLEKQITTSTIHADQMGSDHCPVSIDID
ncbi:MAG: exodeoxyribonuclease [Candidatus Saccharibacteria bacterium]|nr:exodeoxyribonuclease [Candidatus Saccharibacteria bacterium]